MGRMGVLKVDYGYVMFLLCDDLLDDITEMYSQLRSLVLEYLGILPTPDKQSSDMEPATYSMNDAVVGLPYTQRRGQSAPLPTRRLWSHPNIIDSSEMTRSILPDKSPPPARGSVVSVSLVCIPQYKVVK